MDILCSQEFSFSFLLFHLPISKSVQITHIFDQIHLPLKIFHFPNTKPKRGTLLPSESMETRILFPVLSAELDSLCCQEGGSLSSRHLWDVLWNFLLSLKKWSPSDSKQSSRMRSQPEFHRDKGNSFIILAFNLFTYQCEMEWIPQTDRSLPTLTFWPWVNGASDGHFLFVQQQTKWTKYHTIPKLFTYPDIWEGKHGEQIKGMVKRQNKKTKKAKQYQDHGQKIISNKMYSKWWHLRLIKSD